jgi:hypothetical protein
MTRQSVVAGQECLPAKDDLSAKADRFVLLVQGDLKLFRAAANELIREGTCASGNHSCSCQKQAREREPRVIVYEYEYTQAFWLVRV